MKKVILLIFVLVPTMSIYLQQYMVSFVASGAENTVDSVEICNLTQNTSLKVKGDDMVLMMSTTDIHLPTNDGQSHLSVFPNPSVDGRCKVFFSTVQSKEIQLGVCDLTGRQLLTKTINCNMGKGQLSFSGMPSGLYCISLKNNAVCQSRMISSSGLNSTNIKVEYESISDVFSSQKVQKDHQVTMCMDYKPDDLLLFKGKSGSLTSYVTSVLTEDKEIAFEFVQCVDLSGRHYATVRIGEQIWMAENLRTQRYRDGTMIEYPLNNTQWQNNTDGAIAWYDDDMEAYADSVGALYNFKAVSNPKNLAPEGWRVASESDWDQLVSFLGVEAGKKLKSTTTWTNFVGNNLSGFSAIPTGCRNAVVFTDINQLAAFWTSKEYSKDYAQYRQLHSTNNGVFSNSGNKIMGLAVRCVKE